MATCLMPDISGSAVYINIAATREKEIKLLDEELSGNRKKNNVRTYQLLPRHMQRRALSNNPKRLPRALQRRHNMEYMPPKEKSSKRKLRKHRPRARDLPEEYNRRQKLKADSNTWLETHVWHAKRFHMTRDWGYALPMRPTQKMYRPILRAVAERCVVQDRSFLCAVELRGPRTSLLTGLTRLLSPEGAHRVAGCSGGDTWCTVALYAPGRCPNGALTDADLMWLTGPVGDISRLWLWLHPSVYWQAIDALKTVYQLEPQTDHAHQQADILDQQIDRLDEEESDVEMEELEQADLLTIGNSDGEMNTSDDEKRKQIGTKDNDTNKLEETLVKREMKIKSRRLKKYQFLAERLSKHDEPDYMSDITGVSLLCLKDTLNRFVLRGPESWAVLQRVFMPSTVTTENDDIEGVKMEMEKDYETSNITSGKSIIDSIKKDNGKLGINYGSSKSAPCGVDKYRPSSTTAGGGSQWWRTYYVSDAATERHQHSSDVWQQRGKLRDGCLMGVTVRDPRVTMPQCRHKQEGTAAAAAAVGAPGGVDAVAGGGSPLYEGAVRQDLFLNSRSNCEVNRLRGTAAVPGSSMPLTADEDRLPILLLAGHTAAASQHADNSWYEVILPGGFGSVTWTCLVQCGAVAIGIDHETHLMREEVTHCPPYLQPDTPAGRQYAANLATLRTREYFRMPPDKRCNYIRFGVQFPFSQPWSKLVESLKDTKKVHNELSGGLTLEVLTELGIKSSDEDVTSNGAENSSQEDVCVIRNSRYLHALDNITCPSGSRRRIFRGSDGKDCTNIGSTDTGEEVPLKRIDDGELSDTLELLERTSSGSLVRVLITVIGKGSIEPCAMICRPTTQDLVNIRAGIDGDLKPSRNLGVEIEEPRRPDNNEQERKELRKKQNADLARLHRLRGAARRSADANGLSAKEAVEGVDQREQELVSRCAAYNEAVSRLWLPCPSAPIQQCSRLIIGYVTEASFSRVRGCGAGQGYVVLAPILQTLLSRLPKTPALDGVGLLDSSGLPVLIRNPGTLVYRYAMLTICAVRSPS